MTSDLTDLFSLFIGKERIPLRELETSLIALTMDRKQTIVCVHVLVCVCVCVCVCVSFSLETQEPKLQGIQPEP